MVNKIDSKTLGQKNSIPLEPYIRWVRPRAQNIMMSYPAVLQVIMEPVAGEYIPYTILHPDMPLTLKSYIILGFN